MMSESDSPDERRHFTRIPFDADVTLSQGEHHWLVQLIDISLHGVLVTRPEDWPGDGGEEVCIELPLGEDSGIKVNGRVAHVESDHIGLSFENMELESASHLKRLLLFNLGDQSLVDREIQELITIHATDAPGHPPGA
jgi:hypothetical protein